MLVSSGHISATLSASIVFAFTALLFLSGLFLQQQTVRQFRAALALPEPPSPSATANAISSSTPVKSAYAQEVFHHEDVCAALILFSELHRCGSKYDRVLLYPSQWMDIDYINPHANTTKRLLMEAAKRYNVALKRMQPISGEGDVWSLTQYMRVLTVDLPGLLFDLRPFDQLLGTVQLDKGALRFEGFTVLRPVASEFSQALRYPASYRVDRESVVSQEVAARSNITWFDSSKLPQTGTAAAIAHATYIAMKDPRPDRYIPRDEMLAHKYAPPEGEARNGWEGLYVQYKEERSRVCGLELEKSDTTKSVLGGTSQDELKV